jgi:hypothetical protein
VARHRGVWADAVAAIPDGALRAAARARVEGVLASGAPLALGDLAVRGEDLQAAGLAAGPGMGRVLRQLLEEALDDPARNTRETLLARAKELA